MGGRVVNLALFALVSAALLAGFGAFTVGTAAGRWVVLAHGVLGLAILALIPWKTTIARRSIRRQGAHWLSLTLTALVVVTIVSGVAHASGAAPKLGPLSTMQIHVGAGITSLVGMMAHTVMRPVRVRRPDLTRRNFLRGGVVLGAGAIAFLVFEAAWRATGAPGANRRFTGSHEVGSGDPDLLPSTQWLNDTVPNLDPTRHLVNVNGRIVDVATLTAGGDGLQATLDCTGGWHSTQVWSGTRLDRLLAEADGSSIVVRSVTGYWRRFPRAEAPNLLLATHVGGRPLRSVHGAPVRLVAPGRRGFWWVKWVASIGVDDVPWWWQPPLPLA